jgi:TetR/AcrR family transcriptional regulator, regulator of biofilm formation and stress response
MPSSTRTKTAVPHHTAPPVKSSTTRTKPTRPRGPARREALLDAVLRIVAELGTDAVTHRRVAEEAELPLASTTYWFESKEHLLTAALELAAERDIARLRDHVSAGLGPTDPLELAVSAILTPAEPSRSSLITTYALLLEAARRPGLREIAQRWTAAYLDTIGVLLKRAGSRTPRADAELLLAAADGLIIEQLASGQSSELEPQLIRLAGALLERS